jgi:hypothetical protein
MPVEADDPHDPPAIAPDIIPAAWADKVLADITNDAKSHASDQKPGTESGGAPALAIDTTFRAAAVGNVQAPRLKPRSGKWATSTIIAFVFALCSGIAAAWQHYGDSAKQMVSNWTPQFALASSPPPEQTAAAGQPDASAVQASAADQAPPPTAQPPESAASNTAALSPESSPLIQSMARDLAAMGQQIEQLRASIADLKAGQQPMARDISKTSEKTSEARTPEVKTSAVKTFVQRARQKISAPPPPLRSAAVQARRPMPAYPPVQAAAAPPLPLAAPPAAPPQPAPPPQIAAAPEDEPVMRPPLPLR